MIKKIGAVLGAAVAIAVLAACGGGASVSTVTVTQAEPTQSLDITQPTSQEQYVAALRSMGNSYIAGSADKVLLDTGYSVCAALDQGIGVNELVDYLVNQFVSDGVTDNKFYEAVGLIIGASATFLCPQYSNLV